MNNPLRYAGQTYYQGGFEPGDTVSILQVVRNPAWLTPYLSCILVGLGLTVHFLIHLVQFGKRRVQQAAVPARARERRPAPKQRSEAPEAALAAGTMSKSLSISGKRRSS
jgi:hypothetical protein